MHFSYLSVAALALGAIGARLPTTHSLHEKRDFTPEEWVKQGELHPKLLLPVRIGMTQQRLHEGDDLLMEVSQHDSPKYGQWYTPEEIADIFAPSKTTVDAITEWLHSAGFHPDRISQSWNKQWMQLDATVEELSDLLKTKYHSYLHTPTGKEHSACEEYHVPKHIQEHIDYITPGIKLFYPHHVSTSRTGTHVDLSKRKVSGSPILEKLPLPLDKILAIGELQLCGIAVTPPCIAKMYGVPAASGSAVKGNELGIYEGLGDHYSQADLDLFFLTLAENIPVGTSPAGRYIDGATGPTSLLAAGPESDLDFQISWPLIYPQGTVLYQTDDDVYESSYNFAGLLNTFFDGIDGSYCSFKKFGASSPSPLDPKYPHNVAGGYKGKLQCGKYEPTNVISISYGGNEAGLPQNYQRRQCAEIMKLGMQGVSVVVASGDSGVGATGSCIKDKHGNSTIFTPDFPASCPYITSVGATTLPAGGHPGDRETAVTAFASGGGFSNIYTAPKYQHSHVHTYLTEHKPSYQSYSTKLNRNIGPGLFNRNGRGYPDVSAVGDKVTIFNKGIPQGIGGTSASAPLFAAILTRINEERLKKGKKTVGFVNPVLYAHPEMFTDITTGRNPGCGTSGFGAAPGWDPLTGLGTPKYQDMLKVFMSMK